MRSKLEILESRRSLKRAENCVTNVALSMFSSVVPGVLDSVEWLAILEFYLLVLTASDIDLRSPKFFVQARWTRWSGCARGWRPGLQTRPF